MHNRSRNRLIRCAICLAMIVALCLIWQIAMATSPRPAKLPSAPVFSGIVTIRVPLPDEVSFSYAILYVDGCAKCLTNKLPLRFTLDTTRFMDGKHLLKTVLFDRGGVVQELTPSGIVVQNIRKPRSPLPVGATHPTVVKAPVNVVTIKASAGMKIDDVAKNTAPSAGSSAVPNCCTPTDVPAATIPPGKDVPTGIAITCGRYARSARTGGGTRAEK